MSRRVNPGPFFLNLPQAQRSQTTSAYRGDRQRSTRCSLTFPFLGSYFVMASPFCAGANSPVRGFGSDQSFSFFLAEGGSFFSGDRGASAANRQTIGEIAVHH